MVRDYCILNGDPDARLSDFERLTLVGSAGLDRAVRWLGKQISGFSFDSHAPQFELAKIESALHAPFSLDLLSPPKDQPIICNTVVHGLPTGEVIDLAFHSSFVDLPTIPERYRTFTNNSTVRARLWEHRNGAPLTLVAIHGWTMGDQRLNSLAFLPGVFFNLGLNVALIELPFHGRRKPDGDAQFLFPSTDVELTQLAMFQIISDLRQLGRHLKEERGHTALGTLGMSLGAYVGNLWSALDPLACGISLVPLVSMAELAWRLILKQFSREELKKHNLSRHTLRQLFSAHCALSYVPKTPISRQLIIGGRGDTVTPKYQLALLKKYWPEANFNWLSGGHSAHFQRGESLEIIVHFLRELGFVSEDALVIRSE